jgi:hypothetical protein
MLASPNVPPDNKCLLRRVFGYEFRTRALREEAVT